MWNFRKVISTGDTRYLFILDNYFKLPEEYPNPELWEDLFWEYIDKKGIDFNFKLRLELKAKLAILQSEELCEGKKNGVQIMLTERKLDELNKSVKKGNDIENDAVLSKYLGFLIDPKKTTVLQYIGFEKLLKESNEKAKAEHGRTNKR